MTKKQEPAGTAQKKPRRVELTERDLKTLGWIGEQYAAGIDQLQRVLGSQAGPGAETPGLLSKSATRVWVTRMKAVQALEQGKPFSALPSFVWLTRQGLELAGLDFKPLTPKPTTLHHLYQCNQVRLFLAARRAGEPWRSERYLRRDHAQATRQQSSATRLTRRPTYHAGRAAGYRGGIDRQAAGAAKRYR